MAREELPSALPPVSERTPICVVVRAVAAGADGAGADAATTSSCAGFAAELRAPSFTAPDRNSLETALDGAVLPTVFDAALVVDFAMTPLTTGAPALEGADLTEAAFADAVFPAARPLPGESGD